MRIFSIAALRALLWVGALCGSVMAIAQSGIPVPPGKALVYLIQGESSNFASVPVYLNGRSVGSVRANGYLAIMTDPGKHQLSTAGIASASVTLNVEPGKTYYVRGVINTHGTPEFRLLPPSEAQELMAQSRAARNGTVAAPAPKTVPKKGARASSKYAPAARTDDSPRHDLFADSGFYIGAGVGRSTMLDASSALIGTSKEDGDSTSKIFAGYQIIRYVGAELTYAKFGTFTGSGPSGTSDTWEGSGLTGSAVGSWPIGDRFRFIGKLGLTRWSVEDRRTEPGVIRSGTATGASMSWGLGAQTNFTKQMGARFEMEQVSDVGDQTATGKSDIRLLTLGAVYKF